MKLIISTLFLLLNFFAYSQKTDVFSELASPSESGGKIYIFQEAILKQMLLNYSESKKNEQGINGYRVQIYFGSGHTAREKANSIRNSFVSAYPDVSAHVVFQEPNFKVRVGDYRTKSEALALLKKIETIYPGAFIVKDFIDWPNLIE
ncbi:MAG: SPOR domain-containing protein [Bacteroidales bacterium]|nr:SPOR domain-containing protein [Bacteroidales bacterium]